ncbi:MAG: branched-chain amino acid aminotransferase [Bdellovibrionales bacterium]
MSLGFESSSFDPRANLGFTGAMLKIERTLCKSLKPLPAAKDLHFGRHFTDHWFFSKFSEERGWFEAKIEPYGGLTLDPAASVLHYGQALFEGMKAFSQVDGSIKLFRPQFNYRRLKAGAERLCLIPPPEDLFMRSLSQLVATDARWIPSEEGCALYIRPTLIGTEAFLGVRPSREILYYVLLSPVGAYYSSKNPTLKIWVEDKALRAAPGGLGDVKASANYAASLQAAQRAKAKGFDQVLWLDMHHEGIEEVGTMNVFWVFKDEVVTPALNGSILPGNTRDAVLQLLRHQGHKVSERRITMKELMERHQAGELLEAFGTGTAAVISPMGEICYQGKSHLINRAQVGPLSQKLHQTIRDIQVGRLPDPFGWMNALGAEA